MEEQTTQPVPENEGTTLNPEVSTTEVDQQSIIESEIEDSADTQEESETQSQSQDDELTTVQKSSSETGHEEGEKTISAPKNEPFKDAHNKV